MCPTLSIKQRKRDIPKRGRVVCLSKQSRRPTQNKKGTNSIRRSSVEIAAAVFRPLFNWTESSSSCLYLATAQTLHTKWQSPRRLPPLCCCCCSIFAFDVRLIDLAFCDNRNAHRTGFRMFRLLEGSRHQRYVGAQFHIAGRRPGIPRMLRE